MSMKHSVPDPNAPMLRRTTTILILIVFLVCALIMFVGCSGASKKYIASIDQSMVFDQIGPSAPAVDMERIIKAHVRIGEHRVVPQEVIELTMPAILGVVTAQENVTVQEVTPLMCRVSGQGAIALPIVGDISVEGLTLPEIEALVIQAYYPAYTKHRPAVFARIVDMKTYRVSINGAVNTPGLYDMPYDEMTLVSLLMKAGGIIDDGAATIRVLRANVSLADNGKASNAAASPTATASASSQETVLMMSSFGETEPQAHLALNTDISFVPQPGHTTYGRLVIGRQGCTLFQKELDLTDNGQRTAVLGELARCQANVDILAMGSHLQQLAGILSQESPAGKPTSPFDRTLALDPATAQGSSESSGLKFAASLAQEEVPLQDRLLVVEQRDSAAVDPDLTKNIVLPVKGLNIPFTDVALREGDSVIVEKLQMPMFSVMGLVAKSGNFEYPPGEDYSLMEAIGFAGGLDLRLEPQYAVIYRLKPDGEIAHMTVGVQDTINDPGFANSMNVRIKPGDIIMIEHTLKTRTRAVIAEIFQFRIGAYIPIGE